MGPEVLEFWKQLAGFVAGLLSGALLEPIKNQITKRDQRRQLRIMLYQDLGKCLALSERIQLNVTGTEKRQITDADAPVLAKSLNTSVFTYSRNSKPEFFYELPYQERAGIEHVYAELEAWLHVAPSERVEIERYARRLTTTIDFHRKHGLDTELLARYADEASDAWAAAVLAGVMISVKDQEYQLKNGSSRPKMAQ
jgi:hypothetical protein